MPVPSDHLRPTIKPGKSANSDQDSELRQQLESARAQLESREEQLQLQARYVSRLEHEILQARDENLGRAAALNDQVHEVKSLRERLASLAADKAAAMDRIAQIEASRLWRLIAALRSFWRAARSRWRAQS